MTTLSRRIAKLEQERAESPVKQLSEAERAYKVASIMNGPDSKYRRRLAELLEAVQRRLPENH